MDKIREFFLKYGNDLLKPIIVLLCICIIIPLALAVTNKVTAQRIDELEAANQKSAMSRVLKADEYEKAVLNEDGGDIEYHRAVTDGKAAGYIFVTAEKGYGGDVSIMTAVNADGTIAAVEILDVSNETPGLGQNAVKENFYSQFAGLKNKISWTKNNADSENNEIKALTGATVTSKAAVGAVNKALEYFEKVSRKEATADE